MNKNIVSISIVSVLVSYLCTIVMTWLIALCFDISYSIKIATGVWLTMILLRTTFTTTITTK